MSALRPIYAVVVSAVLAGCADNPESSQVNNAIKLAVAAEVRGGKISDIPDGKGISGTYNNAREFFIATKTGDVAGEDNCADFSAITSRPSKRFSLFGDGDTSSGIVRICL